MIPIDRRQHQFHSAAIALIALTACLFLLTAQAEDKKPNIVIIWGDGIGQLNVSAC